MENCIVNKGMEGVEGKMETIKDNNALLAIVYRNSDWKEGLNFITPNRLFLQAGLWFYHKGTKLTSHIHKEYARTTSRTHELVYVKQGKIKVLLYSEKKEPRREFILQEGDFAIMVNGGHGYEILEDNTQVLEAKNGPFTDIDNDKEKF